MPHDSHTVPVRPHGSRSPRRSKRRRITWVTGSAVILLVIVALLCGLVLYSPPAPEPPTAEQQSRAIAHFHAIEKDVDEARKDARAGRPHASGQRLTEEEVNAFLATSDQAQKLLDTKHIERAFVRIGAGWIRATATRHVHGIPVSVTATIRPEVTEGGALDFRIEGIDVGRLGVPAAIAQNVADRMVRALAVGLVDPLLKYKSLRMEKGAVSLRYDTR